ncbi:carboxylate--amine ligase [Chondromyces apiculatus]|nr:ATP-grasp domain-containing protein [Chondromyces apiculatus]
MAGIPVILATRDPDDISRHSRYVQATTVLPAERDQGAAALIALGDRLCAALGRRALLVYGSDKDLDLIYHHRKELADRFLFVLNDEELAWSLLDKERFSRLCVAAGVRAPRTLDPSEDLSALASMREPLLIKPRRKTAWKDIQRELFGGHAKARVFATRRDLLDHPSFARLRGELLIQEHIEGATSDLLSFHGFADTDGNLLASFCGRKVRTFPAFAGESSLIEVAHDDEVDAMGKDVTARLGLKGPFKIDLIRDAHTGMLYVLEINARYTLWHYVGAASGVNLPVIAYDLLVHGRRPETSLRPEARRRWLNFYRDWLAFREQRDEGLTLGAWLLSVARPGTVYEAFAWRDPAPFARWASSAVARKVNYGALRDRIGHSR